MLCALAARQDCSGNCAAMTYSPWESQETEGFQRHSAGKGAGLGKALLGGKGEGWGQSNPYFRGVTPGLSGKIQDQGAHSSWHEPDFIKKHRD